MTIYDWFNKSAPSAILRVALAFGTPERADHIDFYQQQSGVSAWAALKKFRPLETSHLQRLLGLEIARVWVARLRFQNLNEIARRVADARAMFDLVGIKHQPLMAAAVASIPEPKAWAHLNEDGTPKSVKGKATKKKPAAKSKGAKSKRRRLIGRRVKKRSAARSKKRAAKESKPRKAAAVAAKGKGKSK